MKKRHNYHIKQVMDSPTQRMIRIGNSTIGLIGLDVAVNKALASKMPVAEAAESIFQAVRKHNYIPAAMIEKYKVAIEREYRRLTCPDDSGPQGLVIRILGSGCISCNGLQTMVIDAMQRAGVAADIEQIHDRDEIGRLGVTATPALMINGRVRIAGIKPSLAQVEAWIRDAAPPAGTSKE